MVLAIAVIAVSGCSTAPTSAEDRDRLHKDVAAAIDTFKFKDPSLEKFFGEAAGYAVFPSVGKGAIGIGGAYGRGEVFVNGKMIGFCDLRQATIGLQLGGQAYRELVFFKDRDALNRFKSNRLEFSAQASAVAVKAGASTTADYVGGVVVFTMSKAGLMFEVSIGGQKFTYKAS